MSVPVIFLFSDAKIEICFLFPSFHWLPLLALERMKRTVLKSILLGSRANYCSQHHGIAVEPAQGLENPTSGLFSFDI